MLPSFAAPPRLFAPAAIRDHRARAAAAQGVADFLAVEAAERLADRLDDINRRFPRALALGCSGALLGRALAGHGGIEEVVAVDSAFAFAQAAAPPRLVAEAEALPFAPQSFDLVVSNLALHWTNDLPGALMQARQLLRPDGLFLATLWGGETLTELRRAFLEAEAAEEGGAGPHVSPFAELRDLGGLLQRAGFALPVADADALEATYADALALMRDLRAMGESNAMVERRRGFTRRATLARVAVLYHEMFGRADGHIPATFELVTLTAWAPHASQQKPLRPGSAMRSLAEALGEPADQPPAPPAPSPR